MVLRSVPTRWQSITRATQKCHTSQMINFITAFLMPGQFHLAAPTIAQPGPTFAPQGRSLSSKNGQYGSCSAILVSSHSQGWYFKIWWKESEPSTGDLDLRKMHGKIMLMSMPQRRNACLHYTASHSQVIRLKGAWISLFVEMNEYDTYSSLLIISVALVQWLAEW